jgi:DNA polymerase I-like protein with 3'-5' exonuclease and polymerase domains
MIHKFVQFMLGQDFAALSQAARDLNADLHTYVASRVLGKEMESVTPQERNYSKTVLFAWTYRQPKPPDEPRT